MTPLSAPFGGLCPRHRTRYGRWLTGVAPPLLPLEAPVHRHPTLIGPVRGAGTGPLCRSARPDGQASGGCSVARTLLAVVHVLPPAKSAGPASPARLPVYPLRDGESVSRVERVGINGERYFFGKVSGSNDISGLRGFKKLNRGFADFFFPVFRGVFGGGVCTQPSLIPALSRDPATACPRGEGCSSLVTRVPRAADAARLDSCDGHRNEDVEDMLLRSAVAKAGDGTAAPSPRRHPRPRVKLEDDGRGGGPEEARSELRVPVYVD